MSRPIFPAVNALHAAFLLFSWKSKELGSTMQCDSRAVHLFVFMKSWINVMVMDPLPRARR